MNNFTLFFTLLFHTFSSRFLSPKYFFFKTPNSTFQICLDSYAPDIIISILRRWQIITARQKVFIPFIYRQLAPLPQCRKYLRGWGNRPKTCFRGDNRPKYLNKSKKTLRISGLLSYFLIFKGKLFTPHELKYRKKLKK